MSSRTYDFQLVILTSVSLHRTSTGGCNASVSWLCESVARIFSSARGEAHQHDFVPTSVPLKSHSRRRGRTGERRKRGHGPLPEVQGSGAGYSVIVELTLQWGCWVNAGRVPRLPRTTLVDSVQDPVSPLLQVGWKLALIALHCIVAKRRHRHWETGIASLCFYTDSSKTCRPAVCLLFAPLFIRKASHEQVSRVAAARDRCH
jgi:hypothetical protein